MELFRFNIAVPPQSLPSAIITSSHLPPLQHQPLPEQHHAPILPSTHKLLNQMSKSITRTSHSVPVNMQTISGEKPFQCTICEKQFRQLSTLTNHFKIHTGEKPFKCPVCEKQFRQSSTLTNHAKIHTGEKPYNCAYCGKEFRQLSTLTNHTKIHTGEKPFECAVCKKQFRQSSTLNNHIKMHVGDKPFLQEIQQLQQQMVKEELPTPEEVMPASLTIPSIAVSAASTFHSTIIIKQADDEQIVHGNGMVTELHHDSDQKLFH